MSQPLQDDLFHEDVDAAVSHVIAALGGNKRVGALLWPEEPVDQAARKLADCMNPDRPQFLKLKQVIFLLGEARKKGVHSAMAHISRECGYADPQPVEPEDEAAELQRQFIAAQQGMNQILKRMEKLSLPTVRGVA